MLRHLEHIESPSDLKQLSPQELAELAEELRAAIVDTVLATGGHLASNLGVIELTLALHRSFDSPRDKIIWDVGHQTYAHKLLTGRRELFSTLRQSGGLSGFPSPDESEHDPYGTGHASTSISAALGIAVARDLARENYHVVAVIGDGSMTGGLSFEGVNNAAHLSTRLIVVLNDNGMSISPNVGAISKNLHRIRTDPRYAEAKVGATRLIEKGPGGKFLVRFVRKMLNGIRGALLPTQLWEELGFTYIGPVDGHNISGIEDALAQAKRLSKPVLVHVCTIKGRGYQPAEDRPTRFHGVSPTGQPKSMAPTYSSVFGQTLSEIAENDERVVAISAAMTEGTGLSGFAKRFPHRFFDVGIAEEHAVTFAAGLASQGYRPVVAVYSTFLQRAYDQIVQDVCLQRLPVVFAIDRAGLVGDDGGTHQGAFDVAFLRHIPDLVLMAPKDENELRHMLYTAVHLDRPVAVRYPRGAGLGGPLDSKLVDLPVGRAEVLREGGDVALIGYGQTVSIAIAAAELLAARGVMATVINARYAKPMDEELFRRVLSSSPLVITLEENCLPGGFGSAVIELASTVSNAGRVVRIGLPDSFIPHGDAAMIRQECLLSPEGVLEVVLRERPDLAARTVGQ